MGVVTVTIPDLESAYHVAERTLIERTLIETGWAVLPASRILGVTEPRLRRIVASHPRLEQKRQEHGPGRGRPKKK